ncbi:hypothetical protein BH09SUM1_BH09SUM1_11890 [soil metagenome]
MSTGKLNPNAGKATFLSNGAGGWNPASLIVGRPVTILRFRDGVSSLFTPGEEQPFHRAKTPPLALLEDLLARMKKECPADPADNSAPAMPLAIIAASYEFGRNFSPHEHCFPHASNLKDDEFFAAIFSEAASATTASPMRTQHGPADRETALRSEISQSAYEEKLGRIQSYLEAGDIYQANLTLAMAGHTSVSADDLFARGITLGGAAFAAMCVLPEGTMLCFSPELYLRRRGRHIETRPIKGTRVIAPGAGGEAAAREALAASEKDRAEHLMIVDLERSDLGRLCETGSVRVDPFMEIVTHPTVAHMESVVTGTLREGVTLTDLFAATFPGGSVTGAPKKRALEIIAELEDGPRGIYCGAFGWVDANGDCELNLPIRTAMIRPSGEVEFHTGSGIVADSVAAEEWQELMDKAKFFEGVLRGEKDSQGGKE